MGRGASPDGKGEGSGGGVGLVVRPAGVFVIRRGEVSWHPAIDLNRIILGGQLLAVVALVVLRSILNQRGNVMPRDVKGARGRNPGRRAAPSS